MNKKGFKKTPAIVALSYNSRRFENCFDYQYCLIAFSYQMILWFL